MTPKVKSILTVCGILALFPILTTLLILFHDFLYLFIAITSISSCLGITGYVLYEVVYEEMNKRHVMHEQLYHGRSAEYQRWLDFFLDYFGDEEFK